MRTVTLNFLHLRDDKLRGFANNLYVGDVVAVEYREERYEVRVVSCVVVPNCITPYVELEIL